MKSIFIWMVIIPSLAFAQDSINYPLKLSEVAAQLKLSNEGLNLGQLQVNNARQRVRFARANLLPKLNIWRLSSVLIDWRSAGEVLAEDLVPFLVPANWQRVKEEKLFKSALEESIHGLQKNTILQAKLLYLQLQQDTNHWKLQRDYYDALQSLVEDLKQQSLLNPNLYMSYVEASHQHHRLATDLLDLELLIAEERQQLSLALGLSSPFLAETVEEDYVVSTSTTMDSNPDDHSCELKEFDYLLDAASHVKREIQWSILGTSDQSRGIAGGVFNEIPVQGGLGLGMGASLNIHRNQVSQLKRSRQGIAEIVARQGQLIVTGLNLTKEQLKIAMEKLDELKLEMDYLILQRSLGSQFNFMQWMNLLQELTLQKIEISHLQMKINGQLEKQARMLELGDYHIKH
jgi:hypothetical protein